MSLDNQSLRGKKTMLPVMTSCGNYSVIAEGVITGIIRGIVNLCDADPYAVLPGYFIPYIPY